MNTLCRISVVGLVGLLMVAAWVKATEPPQGVDGNLLLRQCSAILRYYDSGFATTESRGEMAFCNGYVLGTLEMNAWYRSVKTTVPLFCPPDNAQTGQAIRVIVRYLQAHPEQLHKSAGFLVTMALIEGFPCPPGTARPQK